MNDKQIDILQRAVDLFENCTDATPANRFSLASAIRAALEELKQKGDAKIRGEASPVPSSQTPVVDCIWTEDEDGAWHTTCDHIFEFTNDGIKENGFKFCAWCGRVILEGKPAPRNPDPRVEPREWWIRFYHMGQPTIEDFSIKTQQGGSKELVRVREVLPNETSELEQERKDWQKKVNVLGEQNLRLLKKSHDMMVERDEARVALEATKQAFIEATRPRLRPEEMAAPSLVLSEEEREVLERCMDYHGGLHRDLTYDEMANKHGGFYYVLRRILSATSPTPEQKRGS